MDGIGLPEDWTDEQRAMFSRVFRFMMGNQYAFCHPGMAEVAPEHWKTLSNNAAWAAAEFMETEELTIVDLQTGHTIASTPKLAS